MPDKIRAAYRQSKDVYDGVLTQGNFLARAYIRFFWDGTDDTRIARELLSRIDGGFSGAILDVPCGTAVFTAEKWLSMKGAEITCLDYSPEMLGRAKTRLGGAAHVKAVQGDVGSLPFEDGSFGVVLSMNGFHAFPDKERAFAETSRVLEKGGKFIASFYVRGKLARADWLVNRVLSRKGWFTPPFHTEDEAREILSRLYARTEVHTDGAMLWCVCEK